MLIIYIEQSFVNICKNKFCPLNTKFDIKSSVFNTQL